MENNERQFPPQLGDTELRLLRWLLPKAGPGYDACFKSISGLVVIGMGRWGDGNFILGQEGATVDLSLPVERVFAYGVVRDEKGTCTVVVHEEDEGQIELQFALTNEADLGSIADSTDRYSYSYWTPGDLAPSSATKVRSLDLDAAGSYILAIAPGDKRIWLHERASGVNHLIPHMKFHNELMRQIGIRDRNMVFNPKLMFAKQSDYKDSDLRAAFIAYNKIWKKFTLPDHSAEEPDKALGLLHRIFKRH